MDKYTPRAPDTDMPPAQTVAPAELGGRAFRLTSAYGPGETAYGELGGLTTRSDTVRDTTAGPSNESDFSLLLAKADFNSEEYRTTHPEIVRAHDLALGDLTYAQFRALELRVRGRLAVATHTLLARIDQRARIIMVDGNFENPLFDQYGLTSQDEAIAYGAELEALGHAIRELEITIHTEALYKVLSTKLTPRQLQFLKNSVGEMSIMVSEKGEVQINDADNRTN